MNDITASLVRQKCAPCEGGVPPLESANVQALLKGLQGWTQEGSVITKTYTFRNYFETMAFVNAAAWVSHREDHHPDIVVGYNEARVSYVTHAIRGLSNNDFICAAKLDALFDL
ncbi:MAG: 4a-hydroxytetrahydrobiopterin dehydratase [Burkholderiales bacterium]